MAATEKDLKASVAKDLSAAEEAASYVITYAKQETLTPLVRSLRSLGKGLAGAFLLGIGTILLAVGFLRAIQSEWGAGPAHATGPVTHGALSSWSWVPYMGAALVCLAVATWCGLRIIRGLK